MEAELKVHGRETGREIREDKAPRRIITFLKTFCLFSCRKLYTHHIISKFNFIKLYSISSSSISADRPNRAAKLSLKSKVN